MTQQFEDFVNAALDKSLASDVTLPTANKIPVYTGIGRQVTGKTPDELGLAVLVDGVVPANQLPSYVDDALEFANLASFPVTGESGKVYVAIDTNKTYRWSGSTYVQIGSDLALGETPSTAYRGDRGKTAYDHSQATGNPHGATTADINDSANKRYITDAQQTVLSNTSGSNSGDETQASIKTTLGAASSGVDGYLTGSDWDTFNNKEQGGYITVSSSFTAQLGKKYRTIRELNSAITITPPATTVDGAYFTVYYSYMTANGSVTCTNPNISVNAKDTWQEYEYTYDAASGGWLALRKSLGPIVPVGSNFQLVNPTTPDAKFIIQAPTSTGLYTLTMPNANVDLGDIGKVSPYLLPTASFTAIANRRYSLINATGSIDITLPTTPTDGDTVEVYLAAIPANNTVRFLKSDKDFYFSGNTSTSVQPNAGELVSTYLWVFSGDSNCWIQNIHSLEGSFTSSKFTLRDTTSWNKIAKFNVSGLTSGSPRTITVPDADVDLGLVGQTDFLDTAFRISDNTDSTKKIAFEASGIGTGQTRTIIMPDVDVNLASYARAYQSTGLKTTTKQLYAVFPTGSTGQRHLTTDGSTPTFIPPESPFLFIPLPSDSNSSRPVLVNVKGIGYSTNSPASGTWVFERRIIFGRGTEGGVNAYGGVPLVQTVSDFSYGPFAGAIFRAFQKNNAGIVNSQRVLCLTAEIPNNTASSNLVVRVIAEIIYSEDTLPNTWL